ncbi:hypothetical protein EJB05_22780, partial [Eragrostis curvula]
VLSSTALLLAFLAVVVTARVAAGFSVCDNANCGKGNCSEVPGIIPTYKCQCDPGWSQAVKFIPIFLLLCLWICQNVLHGLWCHFDTSCLNLTKTFPPPGIPVTDICAAVDCGSSGTCKKGGGSVFAYRCECQPGSANLLNNNAMPCFRGNCKFEDDCAKLGLTNPPRSVPGPSPAPAPVESGHQN